MTEQAPNPERLRPVADDDAPFLFELYASTRAEEFAAWGLDPNQMSAVVELQFYAQRQHYQMLYPEAEHSIVEVDGRPVGRLLVDRNGSAHCLVDIALLPEHCGGGIGTRLIRAVMARAEETASPVVLHVFHGNRAFRLYDRLGFKTVADSGTHLEMVWTPT